MTLAMWFAWLLRGDIRGGVAPENAEGQREFVVWWLLWGRSEYPMVWRWGHAQAVVAMELIPIGNGLKCPRLLRRLHASRQDLQQTFELRDEESLAEYLCWYRLYGPLELEAAPSLPDHCLAATEAASGRKPWSICGVVVPRIAIALAHRDLGILRIDGSDIPSGCRFLVEWYAKYGQSALPPPKLPQVEPPTVARPRLKTDGVNLVGFVRGQFGLGEDVRMASVALHAVGLPHLVINVPAGPAVPQQDNSLSEVVTDQLLYKTTIYCMSAFDLAVLYLARGPTYFTGQYRIGYWPWELPAFPAIWKDVYKLVDEVWAASTYTVYSHRTQCKKPVHRLPCPVIIPSVQPESRRRLGLLNEQAFLFVYPFDLNSHLARKNPLALVRAFRIAFEPSDESVALLLRINGQPNDQPGWAEVHTECARDRRISVLAGTLDRQTALAVIAAADCLVSPHRAEGFGRNIAEAILLGVPVLATGFSGCKDFLAPEEQIPFNPVPLRTGDYPFGEGTWWADPSIRNLALRMQEVRAKPGNGGLNDPLRLAQRRADIMAAYDPSTTGEAFVMRLREISG